MKYTFNSKNYICNALWLSTLFYVFAIFFLTSATCYSQPHGKKRAACNVFENDEPGFSNNLIAYRNKHKQKRKFDELSPDKKAELKKRYEEWRSLPKEEKEKIRKRKEMWNKMNHQEKKHYQRRHKQWKKMKPEVRKRLRNKLEQFENLSPKEQHRIRQIFAD